MSVHESAKPRAVHQMLIADIPLNSREAACQVLLVLSEMGGHNAHE